MQAEAELALSTNDYFTAYDENYFDKDGNRSTEWKNGKVTNTDQDSGRVGAKGTGAIAAGLYAQAGQQTVTIGNRNAGASMGSVYVGEYKNYNTPTGTSVLDGLGNNYVTSVGFMSNATKYGTIAIGAGASAKGEDNNVTLGTKDSSGTLVSSLPDPDTLTIHGASVSLGYSAQSEHGNIAIGANSVATDAASKETAKFRDNTDSDYNAPSSYVSVGSSTLKRRITNVAAGADENDVATVGQLKKVADNKVAWKLTTAGDSNNASTVNAGDTVDFSAAKDSKENGQATGNDHSNLTISKENGTNKVNMTVGLSDNVVLGQNVSGKGGSLDVYRAVGDASSNQLGSHVRIDGSTVSVRYDNGTDSNARGAVLGIANDSYQDTNDATKTVSSPLGYVYLRDGGNYYYLHGAMHGDTNYQGRLAYDTESGSNYIANLDDGLKFTGDTENTTVETKLDPNAANNTLSIKGGVTDSGKLTSGNIGVVATANTTDEKGNVTSAGGLTIQLAKDLTGITSITSQTTGSTTGAKVTLDTKDNNIDVNQGKVTNLSDGTVDATSTDAVTGKQLYNLDNSSVKYDTNGTTVDKTKITLAGGATGTTITNVKAGTISANSTDAVNGAQLYAEQQARANDKTKYYSVHEGLQIDGFSTNENNDGATDAALAGMAAGYETGTTGIFSTVVGSYSGVKGSWLQGAAAVSVGTVNVNSNTDTSKIYSGVANSIVGQANMTTDSNAAIIVGAGNSVTNSYRELDKDALSAIKSAGSVSALKDALQAAVPKSGAQVMVMGGGNNVESAYMSQVVGVGNTVTGADSTYAEGTSTQYNFVDGFQNELTNGKNDYIIGSNNSVTGDSINKNQSNIVVGDNHTLNNEKNNVVLGSADSSKELAASDAVVIGHNADVSVNGGVAIGSGSVSTATNEEDAEGYDPISTSTNKASTNASATWKATTGAVSIGGGVNGNTTTTRRITNLAAGFNDTDAVNVAQIKKLANIDASNIGTNLKGSDSKTAATTDEQNTNENAWGAAIGTGNVEANNGQLVTGGTVFSALQEQKNDLTNSLSVSAGWGIDIVKNNKNGNLISLQRNLGNIVKVNGERSPSVEVGRYAFILGGEFNNYRSYYNRTPLRNTKWGARGDNSVVVGGFDNLSSGRDSVELGGFLNEANGTYSSVLGGEENITKGSYSTVIGGWDNYAYGTHSTVVGGYGNVAYDNSAVIGGGGNRAGSCFDGTSISDAIAIGGAGNQAAGSSSVALGGYGANVFASGSTGIAGGSTGFEAYEALAAGYNSTVTVAKGTAIGYKATTNEEGTIAFGHDKGDTYYDGDARYFVGSGTFSRWPQKAYRVSQNFYDANGKQITEKEYMALMNPDYTWNDYNKRPYFEETYTTAYYNRLVKVADGQKAHDTVVMEQLTPYTRSDASNIGANLKTYTVGEDGETITEANATADQKKANENAWGEAIGTGKIADPDASDKETNGSQQLVTGGTVYKALNGGMTKIVIGTPGENGKDGAPGTIGLVGPAGADGKNAEVDITIQRGKDEESKGVKGANGVDGQDGITRIVYKDAAGDHQVATMEDGLKFAGDDGQKDANKVIAKKLNNIVDIIGGAKGDLTEGNIGVNNDSGKLKVQLAQDLTGITSISGSTDDKGAKITLDTTDKNISVNGGSIKNVATNLGSDGKIISGNENNAANMSDVQTLVQQGVDNGYTNGDGITIQKDGTSGKNVISVNQGDGLKFDSGKLVVNTGDGLTVDKTTKALKIKTSDSNLKVDSNGIGLSDKITIGSDKTKQVTIDGTKGEISGLTNTTWDSKANDYSKSTKAATESQVDAAVKDAVKQAGENDIHVAAGSYAVNDQNQVSMNLVDKNNDTKGTVIITDVAKSSEMGDVSKLADGVKNAGGKTTTVVDAINNVNTSMNTKIGDQKYSTSNTSGSNKYVQDGDSITSAIGKLDGAVQQATTAAGQHSTVSAGSNITVTPAKQTDGHTDYQVALNKDITVDSVTAKTATTNTLTVNNSATIGGVTIANKTISGLDDTKIEKGSTNAVNAGTIWNELRPSGGTYINQNNTTAQNLTSLDTQVKKTSDLINSDGKTIKIGGSDAATKIDVNGNDGKGRVITGVVSDANDPTSAANVGYVNGVTAANTQQIYRDMNNAYGRLNDNINKAAAGSNALAALHPLDYDPDDKADFAVGYGHYRNANAAAVGAFYHPNENTMVNVGVSLGNGDPGFNAGVSFKVGRGGAGREAMSKTEMAKVINSQSKEIDALKKDNADKDKRIDALEQKMAEILAKLDKNGK